MIEQTGVVIRLVAGSAEVETRRQSGCGGCSADGHCGTSLLDRVFGRRPVTLLARNTVGAREGDRVVVGVSESGLLGAALAVYLVPILALLAGAGLGSFIGGAESRAWPLAGAAVGLLLALRWLARYSALLGQDPERAPIIVRRLGAEVAPLVAPPGDVRRAG